MSSSPVKYKLPSLFRRLANQKNPMTKRLIDLRESKEFRNTEKAVLVQGMKTIRELRDYGCKINSIIATVEKEPYDESAIKYPANQILQNPDAFPAKKYFVTDVDLTRRILGTASRPGRHEIFAEIPIPEHKMPTKDSVDRFLVFDHVNDPGNLGNLVRSAVALGWSAGVITTGTCDLYNDKTIRASRAISLRWPYKFVPVSRLVEFLKTYDMTPVVADMMKPDASDLWSPELGSISSPPSPGTGLCFWNFKGKPQEVPKRIALILSSEHNGVSGLDDELRVSVPMVNSVESLNVSSAGSMIMFELNRLLKK